MAAAARASVLPGLEARSYRVSLSTKQELAEWVEHTFGVRLVAESCCTGHCAPLDAFAAAYFADDPVTVWKASRGLGGKTVMLALLGLTEAVTLGAGVTLLGGSGEQSQRILSYMTGQDSNLGDHFWNHPAAPRGLVKREISRRTSLKNGGWIHALMASARSVRGPHPARVRLDECLAGWTSIATDRGIIPLREVRRGDLVWGWNGARLTRGVVRHARYMGTRQTFTVRFDNGSTITGTGNHKILGSDRGVWLRIDQLSVGAEVVGATMQPVRRTAPWPRPQQDRPLPFLLGRGKAPRQATAPALQLWSGDQSRVQGLSSLLSQEACGGQGTLHELWQAAEAARHPALSTVLFELSKQGRHDAEDGGGEGDGSQDPRARLSGRTADGGVAQPDGNGIRTFRADGALDPRLCTARPAGRDRSSWFLLARQAERDSSGWTQARYVGTTGLDGAVCTHGPDAQVVRVVGIDTGPAIPVYDLTVPTLHSFVAGGVVVHNCDEMTREIYNASTGQAMGHDDPVTGRRIAAQLVASSTWHNPEGTMTYILEQARLKGWPLFEWCWRETLTGWLDEETVAEKRAQVPAAVFRVEHDLQEPSPERRAIPDEAMRSAFRPHLGRIEIGDAVEGEVVLEEAEKGGLYATGTDWAKDVDWTWILTYRADRHPAELVAFERTGRLPWPIMVEKLNDRVGRYQGQSSHDATGLGKVVTDYLTVQSEPFDFVGKQRTDLISGYLLALEHEKIVNPVIDLMVTEHRFADNEALFTAAKHLPDTIAAAALGWRAVQRARGADIGAAREAHRRARRRMREE